MIYLTVFLQPPPQPTDGTNNSSLSHNEVQYFVGDFVYLSPPDKVRLLKFLLSAKGWGHIALDPAPKMYGNCRLKIYIFWCNSYPFMAPNFFLNYLYGFGAHDIYIMLLFVVESVAGHLYTGMKAVLSNGQKGHLPKAHHQKGPTLRANRRG